MPNEKMTLDEKMEILKERIDILDTWFRQAVKQKNLANTCEAWEYDFGYIRTLIKCDVYHTM